MTFCIGQQEAIGPGLRRVAREQIDEALGQIADPDVPQDQKIHALRTCCKAVRSVLRLLRPSMCVAFMVEDQRLRAAARLVAELRDSAVLADSISSFGGLPDDVRAAPAMTPHAAIGEAARLVMLARNAIDTWPTDVRELEDLEPGFRRTYRGCLDAWDRVVATPGNRKFHRLRRLTKYHWFQIRALMLPDDPWLGQRCEQLDRLQHSLGQAHDLVVLRNHLASRDGYDERILKNAARRRKKLYEEALEIGGSVYGVTADELLAHIARGRQGHVPET